MNKVAQHRDESGYGCGGNSGVRFPSMATRGAGNIAKRELSDEPPRGKRRFRDISAVWGIVGALLGAVVAGAFSVVAASISADSTAKAAAAEAQRSQHDFFVAQRVATYAELLANAQAFQLAAHRYEILRGAASSDGAATSSALAEARTSFGKLTSAAWSVEVITQNEKVKGAKEKIARLLDDADRLLEAPDKSDTVKFFEGLDEEVRVVSREFSAVASAELSMTQ
jgi:hypothetical protein